MDLEEQETVAPVASTETFIVEGEEMDFDHSAILPGHGEETLLLSDVDRSRFAHELCEVIEAYDQSMVDRLRRWKEIQRSYDMIPDAVHQGQKADAARMISEVTRSYINIAASRITEGITGLTPLLDVRVLDGGDGDEETKVLVEAAESYEKFVEEYEPLDLEGFIPSAVHCSVMHGDCIGRVRWHIERDQRLVRKAGGTIDTIDQSVGQVRMEVVASEDAIVWPLNIQKVQNLSVIGHRSYMTPIEFRLFAQGIGLGKEKADEIINCSRGRTNSRPLHDDKLKGRDVDAGHNPFKAEIKVTELWGKLAIPGVPGATKFQAFLWEEKKEILWVGRNALLSRKYPFFKVPYWPETGSFWGSGVGHELLFVQAADSSMWNMQLDNMKVTGAHVRVTKTGSIADAMADQVAPGMTITTDNPEEDIRFMALGGELSQIKNAEANNEKRGMRVTAITSPLQGFGDPTLKSGASPSSQGQLIAEAGKKFGQADKNIRKGLLSEGMVIVLEFIQQYMPSGIFYSRMSDDEARRLDSFKFMPPIGDFSRSMRITARAPSAASNKETLKQHIMILYRMSVEHLQLLMSVGTQISAANPAGHQRLLEEMQGLVHTLFIMSAQQNDVPGLNAPQMPELTDQDKTINDLNQQLQQMQQAFQQMMQQAQAQPPQAPPGGPQGQQGAFNVS